MNIHSIMSMVKNYKWQSIFFAYWRLIMLVAVIPLTIISSIFYFFYTSSVRQDAISTISTSYGKSASSFSSTLDRLDLLWIDYNNSSLVQHFATMDNVEPDTMQKVFLFSDIQKFYRESFKKEQSLISVELYCPSSDYILSSESSGFLENSPYKDMFSLLINSDFLHKRLYKSDDSTITVAYKIESSDKSKPILALTIENPKLYDNLIPQEMNCAAIYDYNSSSLIKNFGDTSKISIPDKSQFDLNDILPQHSVFNKNFLTVNTYLPNHNLTVINHIFIDGFYGYNKTSSAFIIFLFILLILIATALSFFASFYLYKSILQVIIDTQLPDVLPNPNTNELDFITNNLIMLTDKNNSITNELPQKILQLKKAQTLALQAQISPHFISNTLNITSLMVSGITRGDNEATRVLSLLSDILRASLESSSFITTLREEISYAEKYIEIEQIKTQNSFTVLWDIQEDCLEVNVAKFMLQPIIENSINHGFKLHKSKENTLTVSAYKNDSTLIVKISDNASEIPYEKLREIRDYITADDELRGAPHIGLRNVNQRISLIFGEEYGVKINSADGSTTVTITIPVQ